MLEQGRLALSPNAELDEELLAQRVTFTSSGKTALAPKDDVRARLGRSPDFADALVISYASELHEAKKRKFVFR